MNSIKNIFHRLFIPSDHNNHRGRLIGHTALTLYLIAAVGLTIFIGGARNITSTGTTSNSVLGLSIDISPKKLLDLTNEKREAEGLSKLTLNEKLNAAAKAKAADMFAKNYWAHFGPNGETPWQFIESAGYQYDYAGENLAKNFLYSDGVVDAWMNSPTHRANILKKEYSEIGFAIVNGDLNGEQTTLVVQMFGHPTAPMDVAAPVSPTPYKVFANGAVKAVGLQPVGGGKSDTPYVAPADTQSDNAQPASGVKNKANDIVSNQMTAPESMGFFQFLQKFNMIFVAILILAFILDLYYLTKNTDKNLSRNGKQIAHIIFLTCILLAIFILGKGKIL